MKSESPCAGCGKLTTPRCGPQEYYMVWDEVWAQAGMEPGRRDGRDGYLCIACLEHRLGRELCASDFTDAPVNWLPGTGDSPRLADRKQRVGRR